MKFVDTLISEMITKESFTPNQLKLVRAAMLEMGASSIMDSSIQDEILEESLDSEEA